MHYRILVTFNTEHATTSEEARRHVQSELEQDTSFLGGGRFHPGFCDWFVLGGRWSGELSRATWGRETQQQIKELQEQAGLRVWGAHYADEEKREQQASLKARIEKLYAAAMPEAYRDKGLVYARDTYQDLGYEDDAMVVTQELYDALLAGYAGTPT